jgi:nucleoside-diphosphate-sugar epimerase
MKPIAYVTGSNGFLGLNLVEELLEQGWRVIALHRPGSDVKYLGRLPAERVEGDITDRASLAHTLPRNVDAVFHVAASTNLWSRANAEQDRVNIEGTRNVVDAALAARARRLVHTSTISVYGMQSGRIDERAAQLGRESWVNYQRSKFRAEEEVRAGLARGLDAVILNPSSIIGRYDRTSWARMILLVDAGKLPGVPPGAASFCHGREVARAHIAAAGRGARGQNYLLGGADATYLELVRAIAGTLGKPLPPRATPAWVLRAVGAAGSAAASLTGRRPTVTPETAALVSRRLQCDCGKAMRELGYRPVELRAMVEESCRWLQDEGFLNRN